LERLLVNTGELVAAPYLRAFSDRSPESVLGNSLNFLDPKAVNEVKAYLKRCSSDSGGFCDRGGKADLYYTLFGFFIAKAFGMNELFPAIFKFAWQKIRSESLSDVDLHCAAIVTSDTPAGWGYPAGVVNLKKAIRDQLKQQKIYNSFLSLLTCYYLRDYYGIYIIRKYLGKIPHTDIPCSLLAAELVLHTTFKRKTDSLVRQLLSYYDNHGGFKATRATRGADLLSTSVALYALKFADFDLRTVRPDCLDYVDSLYDDGGFAANTYDPDTDIEYTFYGLLALGALTI
jgi:hypothetical protein